MEIGSKEILKFAELKRILAWVYRFVSNCFLPKEKRVIGELLPEEIMRAEIQLIKHGQREHSPGDY